MGWLTNVNNGIPNYLVVPVRIVRWPKTPNTLSYFVLGREQTILSYAGALYLFDHTAQP